MSTAVYNALEQAQLVPGKTIPATTYEQAVQTWRTGGAEGFLLPDIVAPPNGTQRGGPLFKRYVVLLTPRIISDVRTVMNNGTLVASPEERDCLARLLTSNRVASKNAKDIRLLTQEQYLTSSDCVDVYCTSVVENSTFLSQLTRPYFVTGVNLTNMAASSYDPTKYEKAMNLDRVSTSCYYLRRGF